MVDLDVLEKFARNLSEVRRTLVGDGLGSLETGQGLLENLLDVRGAFSIVDDDILEKVIVSTADILTGDELELYSEDVEVGGVGRELCTWQCDVKVETTASERAGFGGWVVALGLDGIAVIGTDGCIIAPPAKGSFRDTKRSAELSAGDG
jgi:hypothetical protein